MPTNKSLSNSSVANETSASVVHVTISKSLIDCPQVQVDSVVKIVRQNPILSKLTRQFCSVGNVFQYIDNNYFASNYLL